MQRYIQFRAKSRVKFSLTAISIAGLIITNATVKEKPGIPIVCEQRSLTYTHTEEDIDGTLEVTWKVFTSL